MAIYAQLDAEGVCRAEVESSVEIVGASIIEVAEFGHLNRRWNGVSWEVVAIQTPLPGWKIWVGSFKDRLGMANQLALGASTHPVALAVKEALYDRKYVDLQRPDVVVMLDLLISNGLPASDPNFPGASPLTADDKARILTTPPSAEEEWRP